MWVLGQQITSPGQGVGECLMSGHKEREQMVQDLRRTQAAALLVARCYQHRHNIARIALLVLMTGNYLFQNRFDTRNGLTNAASITNTWHVERELSKGNAEGVIHGLSYHGHSIAQRMFCSTEVHTEECASLNNECEIIHLFGHVDLHTGPPPVKNPRRHLAH